MRYRLLIRFAGIIASVACTTTRAETTTNIEPMPAARAEMRDVAGRSLGTVAVLLTSDGVRLSGALDSVPAGVHGLHFHQVGRCDTAGATPFESAGGHYNPAGRKHGTLNPEGPHAGDLPNVTAGADGRVVIPDGGLTVTMGETARNGLFDPDGTALVLHAATDDYRTDPSGNSGARIACGVVRR